MNFGPDRFFEPWLLKWIVELVDTNPNLPLFDFLPFVLYLRSPGTLVHLTVTGVDRHLHASSDRQTVLNDKRQTYHIESGWWPFRCENRLCDLSREQIGFKMDTRTPRSILCKEELDDFDQMEVRGWNEMHANSGSSPRSLNWDWPVWYREFVADREKTRQPEGRTSELKREVRRSESTVLSGISPVWK